MSDTNTERTEYGAPGIPVKALAKYIKEQKGMTWEETCEFLLKLTVSDFQIQQQLLDQKVDQKVPRHLQLIIACAMELGWGFAVPSAENGTDNLNGFILGNREYIDSILSKNTKVEDGFSDVKNVPDQEPGS